MLHKNLLAKAVEVLPECKTLTGAEILLAGPKDPQGKYYPTEQAYSWGLFDGFKGRPRADHNSKGMDRFQEDYVEAYNAGVKLSERKV